MQANCKRCYFQLREHLGMHRAGEPYVEQNGIGDFITCPKCGYRNRLSDLTGFAEHVEPPKPG